MSLLDSKIVASCRFEHVNSDGKPYTELWEFEKHCHRKTWRIGDGWAECIVHFDRQFLGYSAVARGVNRAELETVVWPRYAHPLGEYPKFWDQDEVLNGLYDGTGIALVQSTYDSRNDVPDVAAFQFAEILRTLLPLPRENNTDSYYDRADMFNRGLSYLQDGYPALTYLTDGLTQVPDPWNHYDD